MSSPPILPSKRVVIYNCLSGDVHHLGRQSLEIGSSPGCDIQLGEEDLRDTRIRLSRSGKSLQLEKDQGSPEIEVNGSSFGGGLLPDQIENSLMIGKRAFFLIRKGEDSTEWGETLKKSPRNSWQLRIIEGGRKRFDDWKRKGCPAEYPDSLVLESQTMSELFDEISKRNWDDQIGIVYSDHATAGFFAHQFLSIAKPDHLPDAGDNRCPRCWMRFDTGNILAVHPSDYGDEVLGTDELTRFLPNKFDPNGKPLTKEGQPCSRLACPHCRGELPPDFLAKPPHLMSIVGDSMAGKSYFLTVAVNQLQKTLRKDLKVSFTDGDPKGNEVLSKMRARLFSPTDDPKGTFLGKTELAGATYKEFRRYGRQVKLPAPFSYNLTSRERGSASLVFYDNAGEHFRPGGISDAEKSDVTEHIAWASGILFLFDPLQHRELLLRIDPELDPQVGKMKSNAGSLRFDQDVILAEMGERLRNWRQNSFGHTEDVPLAFVVGKHDLLEAMFPRESLENQICSNGSLSRAAIEANSARTEAFLLEHCSEIVGAAEAVSSKVRYFPVSSFGIPAIELDGVKDENGQVMCGPKPSMMHPYLVEAPFLWLLSEIEPDLISIK